MEKRQYEFGKPIWNFLFYCRQYEMHRSWKNAVNGEWKMIKQEEIYMRNVSGKKYIAQNESNKLMWYSHQGVWENV